MNQNCRIIRWDDVELPFGNPPSTAVPKVPDLIHDAEAGMDWHWYYKGLLGIIPNATLRNAAEEWRIYDERGPRRDGTPKSVGKFTWAQTVSMEEAKKFGRGDSAAEASSGGESSQ